MGNFWDFYEYQLTKEQEPKYEVPGECLHDHCILWTYFPNRYCSFHQPEE